MKFDRDPFKDYGSDFDEDDEENEIELKDPTLDEIHLPKKMEILHDSRYFDVSTGQLRGHLFLTDGSGCIIL